VRVLLVNPPFFRFSGLEQDYVPLGLQAVGSQLAEDGHEVAVKNLEVGSGLGYQGYEARASGFDRYLAALTDPEHAVWQELRQTIEAWKPDKLGVSVLNVKHRAFRVIHHIAVGYGLPVFVGGPHTVIDPGAYPPGVEVMPGEFESHGGRLASLDQTPMPNFDILLDSYSPDAHAHLMTSRGCPFRCRFCSSKALWKRRVTYKSVDRILAEMQQVHDRYRPEWFTFWDETFTAHKGRLQEFCSRYFLSTAWRCDTRADRLDDLTVKMMVAAGCGQMSIGIESGVDRILKYVWKDETTTHLRRAAEVLNKHRVRWKAYLIIGFPEETEEDIRETVAFAKSLQPFRITLSLFTPYKGTPLFGECVERGLITDNYDVNDLFHQRSSGFCPDLTPALREEAMKDVDEYNAEAVLTWK
jgi:radical SAM superfamily enzyme YgiQ (UPF0313 family)